MSDNPVSTDLQAIAATIEDLRTEHRRDLEDLLAQRARLVARAVKGGMPARTVAGHLGCTPSLVAKIAAGR